MYPENFENEENLCWSANGLAFLLRGIQF